MCQYAKCVVGLLNIRIRFSERQKSSHLENPLSLGTNGLGCRHIQSEGVWTGVGHYTEFVEWVLVNSPTVQHFFEWLLDTLDPPKLVYNVRFLQDIQDNPPQPDIDELGLGPPSCAVTVGTGQSTEPGPGPCRLSLAMVLSSRSLAQLLTWETR